MIAVLIGRTGIALDFLHVARLAVDWAAAPLCDWRICRRAADQRSDMTAYLCDVARSARDSVEPVLLGADNLIHPGLRRTPATESAGRSTVLGVAAPSRDLRDDRGRVVLATDDIGAVRCAGAMCLAPAGLPLLGRGCRVARHARRPRHGLSGSCRRPAHAAGTSSFAMLGEAVLAVYADQSLLVNAKAGWQAGGAQP
jgi:hypothetical protein